MWVIRKNGKIFNLANVNMLKWDGRATTIMIGQSWWILSENNVLSKICDALRRGDNYVEVD